MEKTQHNRVYSTVLQNLKMAKSLRIEESNTCPFALNLLDIQ